MWTILGPFDGEDSAQLDFSKTKLLKPGSSYAVGRKNQPLVINSKKISQEHCVLTVGAYSKEDVSDPAKRPSLQIFNTRDKSISIKRDGQDVAINGHAAHDLQDGDQVALTASIPVRIRWEPVCCFLSPQRSNSISLDSCASLGISVVHSPSDLVTHHITSVYSATAPIATSLITSCQFVKPEWLNEVIRVNSDPESREFSLPSISKFRPSFSPSLSPEHKTFDVWAPNEQRSGIFEGFRFLCVGEKGRELDSGLRDLITTGGGAIETFDVQDGKMKWHRALSRGTAKEDQTLLTVGDKAGIIAAIGHDGWKELVEEARIYKRRFVSANDIIIIAVLNVDIKALSEPAEESMDADEGHRSSSPLPSFVPNTLVEEMTIPPEPAEPESKPEAQAPRKKLVRRVVRSQSQDTQPEPESSEVAEAPRPRKVLTRRVNNGKPIITGLDDPSIILNTPDTSLTSISPELPAPAKAATPVMLNLTAPGPARSSRLKRRVGVTETTDSVQSQFPSLRDSAEEPPHKKFKALFDATGDPESADSVLSQTPLDDNVTSTLNTQSQSGDLIETARTDALRSLETVPEESDESQATATQTQTRTQSRKRKAISEDAEMDDVQASLARTASSTRAGSVAPPSKRQAIENMNSVVPAVAPPQPDLATSNPPSSSKPGKASGAAPGKPDTDPVFLKAVASSKRGKKTEDEFDREFNKLKISKPEIGRAEQEDQWAILEEFGDESNIRGNFMVIVELDVHKDRTRAQERQSQIVTQWQGKPNFKKFKKKDANAKRTPTIELVISESQDYGLGAGYWKTSNSQAPNQSQSQFEEAWDGHQGTQVSRSKGRALVVNDSDEEESFPTTQGKRATRAGSVSAARKASRAKSTTNTQPLFLDDDESQIKEEDDDIVEIGDEDESIPETLTSTAPPKRSARKAQPSRTKKAAVVIVDDDSDDDAFKGFKGKKRRR